MFGYVRPHMQTLSEEEKQRYRAVYCGMCRSLRRYGLVGRCSLTYDLAFLALLLSSLYEPEETRAESRCLTHPTKTHEEIASPAIDYAADMTIALMYHKCLDDWQDEHKRTRKTYAELLARHYRTVEKAWPEQCQAIERCISELSTIEKRPDAVPDEAANCFGRLMAALFGLWKRDFWARQLDWFGMSLGRFIYLMDAVLDLEEDRAKGRFNPLLPLELSPERVREMLTQPLGEASEAFEQLPLVQDAHLMRNILYAGVWQAYNERAQKEQEAKEKQHGA